MKKIASLILFLFPLISFATDYFVSSTDVNRNDANAGTSQAAPWEHLSKVNSFMANFQPGDRIFFKKGDTFTGFLSITKAGTSGNPITFSSYGSGSKPVITGFTDVTLWTNTGVVVSGGTIWQSTNTVSSLTWANIVVVNGVNTAMGRTPNAGTTYPYTSSNGSSSVTIAALTGSPNYTGAELVSNAAFASWIMTRNNIVSQSGQTLNTVRNYDSHGFNIYNFASPGFIQNALSTLDLANEWYYDRISSSPSFKKLSIVSSGTPSGVKITTIDSLARISANFITIDGINFQGANSDAIQLVNASNVTVTNCDVRYCGEMGIQVMTNTCPNLTVTNCTFRDIENSAITDIFTGSSNNWIVTGNTFNHIAMVVGSMGSIDGQNCAINSSGTNTTGHLIQNNFIDSVGYLGISATGQTYTVKNNFVQHHCFNVTDCGGVYTFGNGTNRNIIGNIVLNGMTNLAHGIYLDANSSNSTVTGNSVAFCKIGYYIHDTHETTVRDNTAYSNSSTSCNIAYDANGFDLVRNVTIRKNTFVMVASTTLGNMAWQSPETSSTVWGTSDSNRICKPVGTDDNAWFTALNGSFNHYILSAAKTAGIEGTHSTGSPAQVPLSDVRFEYNASNSVANISLGGNNYIDMSGLNYSGTLVLPAWSSIVLLRQGTANSLPIVSAGVDKTITLPTNSVSVTGTASDPDGTISSVTWSKASGPTGGTISTPNSLTTNITGLTQGTYIFQLCATDNSGGTSCDQMTVIVNPAPNQSPSANAGVDRLIQLPTNSVTQTGSGTDPDGTIAAYLWTQVSGPSTATIVSASSATTSFNNLIAGVYVFNLRVTDNLGATANDQFQVTVTVANQSPTANAGTNQTITLPTNSVTLTGSGSDIDGTIASYAWAKISGPATFNIVSPSSATTAVNNLVAGTYVFQLTVTDNQGATGTATVQVLVNPAPPPNQPPVVNAGTDKNITLPTNSITQVGSATDADGTVVSYAWTKISGPATFTIASPTSSTTSISNLVAGTYVFQLTATDNQGATGTDQMTVTVNPAPNQPPVSNAGPDQTLTLPTSSSTFAGSASDADGTITSHTWSFLAGPGPTPTIAVPSSYTSGVANMTVAGTYRFRLTVTDNNGATVTDDMQILVNAAPNQAPTANAGADKNITLPTNSVTQVGSGADVDGTVVAYLWSWVSGPATFNIVSATQATTVINNLVQGTYVFNLRVTDNNGATGNDQVTIVVNPAVNQPPTANAGTNKNITLPTNSVTQVGSGTDPDGTIVAYLWTKISGPATFNIVSPTSSTTVINNLVAGTYVFQLQVTDNQGATATNTVQVVVNPAPPPNQPPIANAGTDKNITLPTNSVTQVGSGTDADGTIASYTWSKISGPATFNIASPTSSTTSISNLVAGTYVFRLTVTDNIGATGTDDATIIVNPAPNVPPVVNAGPDQTITLPTSASTFAGSATDADGTITSKTWLFIAGPGPTPVIANASLLNSGVSNMTVAGSYTFQLSATDNSGANRRDTMIILVNPAPNIPPTSNAGADQTDSLPIQSIHLSGIGTDADGTIVGYFWRLISGPSTVFIVSPTQANTDVTGIAATGDYVFQFQVTDNTGATTSDTVILHVVPGHPAFQLPIVNAGPDQKVVISLFQSTGATVVTGAFTQGTYQVVSVTWTKIAGPAQSLIVSPNTLQTTIRNIVRGTYIFQLTVTDSQGNTATDTIKIDVRKQWLTLRRGKIIIVDY